MSFFNVFSQIMSNPFARWSWAAQPRTIKASEEQLAADQKVLEKSVSDAVNAVLTSEVFTKAVAVHLAEQIQPTLKSSLDISAVEARLVASIKQIDTQTNAKIADLASQIGTNHNNNVGHWSGVEETVGDIKYSLLELGTSLKAVEEQLAESDNTEMASQTVKLDTLTTKLDTIKSELLAAMNGSIGDIATVSQNVNSALSTIESQNDALGNIRIQNAEILSGLKKANELHLSHISAISGIKIPSTAGVEAKLDTIHATVTNFSNKDSSADILAAIKAANDSQLSQATSISEIKSLVSKPTDVDLSGLEIAIQSTTSELKAHQQTLADVKNAVASIPVPAKTDISGLEESLKQLSTRAESHSASLAEIKEATSKPAPVPEKVDLSSLETALTKLTANIDSQSAAVDEIKTKVSTPAAVADKVDLSGVETSLKKLLDDVETQGASITDLKTEIAASATSKSSVDLSSLEKSVETIASNVHDHTATLEVVKIAVEKDTSSDIKISIEQALATLTSQSSTLEDIKSTVSKPAPAAEKVDLSSIETSVGKVLSTLDSQSAALEASKAKLDALSTEAVLTELKSVKSAVEAIPAPAAVTDHADLAKNIQAVKVAVDETKKETESVIVLLKAQADVPIKAAAEPSKKKKKTNGVKKDEEQVEPEAATEA